MNLDPVVKKGLALGIGMTYLTMDALTDALKKLEKEGKISKKESEKLVNDTVKKYQAQANSYAKRAKVQLDSMMKSASPFATKKDIAGLNTKLNRISRQVKKKR